MELKVVLDKDKGAIMPTRAHEFDAGLDLYSTVDADIIPRLSGSWENSVSIDTGVHIQIPKGCYGEVASKSGLNVKHGLTATGIIDSGYTGSIVVKLYNNSNKHYKVRKGDKIAQLLIVKCELPTLRAVDSLEETERGDGGFGSTGR